MNFAEYMKIVERNTPNWPHRDIYKLACDLFHGKYTEAEAKEYIKKNFA